ncbi:MAG TPA: hypothetical protein VGM87_02850 [Roseomonas sp.]|jgi:hypothetical protein
MALAATRESIAPATAPIEEAARHCDWRPLTAGWLVLPTDRLTGFPTGEGPGERRFLLMHADYGAAVLDLWSPEAAPPGSDMPVTRACLDAQIRLATFLRRFDPRLPIRRIHLAEPELPRLTGVLARAFAGMEPLRLGDGGAWMGAVQDALAAPPAIAPPPPPAPRPRAPRRLGLAIGSTFALGATAALALLIADGSPTAPMARLPAVTAEAEAPFTVTVQAASLVDLAPQAPEMARAWPLPVASQPAPLPVIRPAVWDPLPPGDAPHLLPLTLPDGLPPRLTPSLAISPMPMSEPGAAFPALPRSAGVRPALLLPEREPPGQDARIDGAAKAPSPMLTPAPTQPVPGITAEIPSAIPMPEPMPEVAHEGATDSTSATPPPEPRPPREDAGMAAGLPVPRTATGAAPLAPPPEPDAPRVAAEPDPAPASPPTETPGNTTPAPGRRTEPAAAAPAAPALDATVVALLIARGEAMLARGDISAARLLFGRAAAAGSAAALTAMGRSYDPAVLGALGVRGIRPDPEQAALWYRRAAEHGAMP